MADPYCGIVVNFYVFGRYISISTPQWSMERHRPCWLPTWSFETIDDFPCEQSKMFSFDWFFHICVMYGGPSKRLLEMRRRDPQPTPPDDDNILDDDFDDDYDFDDDGEAKAKLIREFDAEVEKYRAK